MSRSRWRKYRDRRRWYHKRMLQQRADMLARDVDHYAAYRARDDRPAAMPRQVLAEAVTPSMAVELTDEEIDQLADEVGRLRAKYSSARRLQSHGHRDLTEWLLSGGAFEVTYCAKRPRRRRYR